MGPIIKLNEFQAKLFIKWKMKKYDSPSAKYKQSLISIMHVLCLSGSKFKSLLNVRSKNQTNILVFLLIYIVLFDDHIGVMRCDRKNLVDERWQVETGCC